MQLPQIRVFQEPGEGGEDGRQEAEASIQATRVHQVVPGEAPQRVSEHFPRRGSAAPGVERFGAPSGVYDHFLQMMREIPIGNVMKAAVKRPDVSDWFQPLVHAVFRETTIPREQADMPVARPAAVFPLSPEEEAPAADPIHIMRRAGQHGCQLAA